MSSYSVLAISPSKQARVYSSVRAASRVLSGTGTDRRRNTVTRRCDEGGGYVGNVWVQYTNMPASS